MGEPDPQSCLWQDHLSEWLVNRIVPGNRRPWFPSMSRGIPSQKALDAALPIAQARGEVMFFRQDPGTPCNFLITYTGGGTVVRIRRARRLHCSVPEIVTQNIEPLNLLRSVTLFPGITREFWLWSPHGTMRFFRVDDGGLIELDRQGEPLKPLVFGSAGGKKSVGQKNPVLKTSNTASGKNESTEKSPGTISQPPCTSKPDHEQSRTGESDSPAIRYLRHRVKKMIHSPDQPASPEERASDGGPPGEIPPPVGDRISPG